MDMTNDKLAKLIEIFASKNGISPSTVTKKAVGNNRIYDTLKSGGSCTLTVANKIEKFIEGAA